MYGTLPIENQSYQKITDLENAEEKKDNSDQQKLNEKIKNTSNDCFTCIKIGLTMVFLTFSVADIIIDYYKW